MDNHSFAQINNGMKRTKLFTPLGVNSGGRLQKISYRDNRFGDEPQFGKFGLYTDSYLILNVG